MKIIKTIIVALLVPICFATSLTSCKKEPPKVKSPTTNEQPTIVEPPTTVEPEEPTEPDTNNSAEQDDSNINTDLEIEEIKANCYSVFLAENISYANSNNIKYIEENLIYVSKNTDILLNFTGILNKFNENCNFYIEKLDGFIVNNELISLNSNSATITVNSNLNISAKLTYLKFAGIAVYQNIQELFYWKDIKANNYNLNNYINISQNNINSIDNFLVYGILDSNLKINANTKYLFNISESNLTLGLELFQETTEICLSLIFVDSNNNYHIIHYSTLAINPSSDNTIKFENIPTNIFNSITNITIEFNNNYSTKK